jgi:hypothetical protein
MVSMPVPVGADVSMDQPATWNGWFTVEKFAGRSIARRVLETMVTSSVRTIPNVPSASTHPNSHN